MHLIDPRNDNGTEKDPKDHPITKTEMIQMELIIGSVPLSNLGLTNRLRSFHELRYIETIKKSDKLLKEIFKWLEQGCQEDEVEPGCVSGCFMNSIAAIFRDRGTIKEIIK